MRASAWTSGVRAESAGGSGVRCGGSVRWVDLRAFNAVELDPTFGTIQWPNGADFDPETLHDRPKYREEFVAMARRWAAASDAAPDQRADPRMEPTRR